MFVARAETARTTLALEVVAWCEVRERTAVLAVIPYTAWTKAEAERTARAAVAWLKADENVGAFYRAGYVKIPGYYPGA